MGATVTTGNKVAAFRRADGEVIYVLYEETYEKNVHPHTPHWDVRGIGTFADVMLRVCQGAASCEGGTLQTRSGHTTPEAYLQSWLNEFKAPLAMPDQEFELKLKGESMFSPIGSDHEAEALRALAAIGRTDLVDALQAGSVTVRLHADVDVIIAIYGVHTNIPLWKILRGGPPHSSASQELSPQKRNDKITIPTVRAFRVDQENVIASVGDAAYEHMGWVYSAVGKYIIDVALPMELRCSGVAKKMISAFRDKVDAAPALPDAAVITVNAAAAEHSYYIDNAKRLAVKLGKASSKEDAPESFEVTFAEIKAAEAQYLLSTLESTQTRWSVPAENEVRLASLPPALPQHYYEQECLF